MKKWIITLLGLVLCAWAFANATVTVQKGDSLGSIAARYGTTVAVLQRLNGLSGVNIRVGQVIKLPSSTSITVQSGDSLQTIAARHSVSVEALRSANGISGDRIRVGQALRLPSTSTVTNRAEVAAKPNTSTASRSVVVEKGDTVGEIAKRFGVSIQALQAANRLEGNAIRVGQTLIIPIQSRSTSTPSVPSRTNTSTVIVQQGDTLGEIAKRNNTSVEALQAANGLNSNAIRVGQTLKLPAQAAPTRATPATIVVQTGDTLEKIAKRNNVSLATLRAANNLSSDAIRVGDTLRLTLPTVKPQAAKASAVSSAAKPNKPSVASNKPTATKPPSKPATSSTKPAASSAAKPATTKPPVTPSTNKPNTTSNTKPLTSSTNKPSQSNTKPIASKPSTTTSGATKPATASISPSAAKPTAALSTSKPAPSSSAAKPTSTAKPISTAKPAVPSSASKPTSTSTTRLIAPPPNLPNATGRLVTVVAAPKPTPQVSAKPNSTPSSTATAVAAPTVKPVLAVAASSQRAPKPIVVTPPTATRPTEPDPSVSVRPADMPSTLGFSDPLEAPGEASVVDPSLESPYLDATAPSSTPTAPSDLIEDVEIEIPENLSAATVKPPVANPSNTTPSYSRAERVLWPLSGTMTSRFGWRRLRGNRFHTGIDLAAPTGTRVYAALSGRVEFAGWNRQGYGYLVIIRGWDNRQYYYGHNSRILVKRGAWVRQGQIISRVGSTGFSTGPHLHFEIRVAGKARNPLAYLPSSRLAQASAVR